ncbi:3' exoribonuclease [Methanohalobium evestigatum Z-7303]|uniref:Exosome complex component Rrp42 n=1 Tax=Methanohalobium evestigatum (strain ATCC BAA-1072 / DSM 3721 / NBRC 107634 / OCM 161 / Z-7303) TaxID=644295 RepID=D7E8G4_METEZ|nr:exosome complex protein Rrp42 [Methanohalobium evestigatum]ADI73506.1 3' exoribonuclease [Methanohalobium evestigatum Z-7303]
MTSEVMSKLKKDYVYHLMLKEKREDNRAFDEIRDISIETDIIGNAEGSAKVYWGDTQLIVGVKLQVGEPFPDTPDKGIIITSLELNPIASPDFEAGPPKEDAIEIARVVDRGIRESGAIDLNKLCITEGEEVWTVFIDVNVLNDDGNIMDAASIGAIAALMTTNIPAESEGYGEDMMMPVRDIPVGISLVDISGELMVDPTYNEESVCDTKITVVSNQDGSISAMQKSGTGSLTEEKVLQAANIARTRASEIREKYLSNI